MDLALAGAGAASVVHALAASAVGAPIVAVASRTPVRSRERAAQVGGRAVALDELPAGADAVIVCTPPDRHLTDARPVLATGGVVLVERPLASTLAAADELVDGGGRVVYGENLVHSPIVTTARGLVTGIGAIDYVEVRVLSPRPTWGSYLDPRRGGGVLFELGASAVALVLLLVGDAPTSVRASVESSPGLEVDDHAELELAFASGTRARVEVDWRASGTIWDLQVSSATDVVRAELAPVPSVEHNGEPVALPVRRFGGDPHVEWLGHAAQLEHLARVVAGDHPSVDATFGRDVLEILCAGYAAAATGGTVTSPFDVHRRATPIDHWEERR